MFEPESISAPDPNTVVAPPWRWASGWRIAGGRCRPAFWRRYRNGHQGPGIAGRHRRRCGAVLDLLNGHRIEEFFLRATSTGSSMATTTSWLARWSLGRGERLQVCPPPAAGGHPVVVENWRHAASVTRGPWSPPCSQQPVIATGRLVRSARGAKMNTMKKRPALQGGSNGPWMVEKVRLSDLFFST